MKKIYRIVLLLLLLIGLSSCLVKVQYYEHAPTHVLRFNMTESGFNKLQKFSDNGVVFAPSFVEMSPDRSYPRSSLMLYSHIIKSIYIDKVILYSGSRAYKKELVLNKEVTINEKFKTFYTESISLFGGMEIINKKATAKDYKEFWNEESAILVIYYRFPGEGDEGELKKMEFILERKTDIDIAWST